MDLIPDALVILQDGRYQIVNSAFTRLFGYTQRDVAQGLSFFELVQEKDKVAVQQRYEDRLAGRQVPRTYRIDLIARDGAILPCEISAAVIEYASRPADLVLIRDVSERVQTEDALQESDIEYRELFENMLEGVYRTLPDGTIIKANPALVEMLGYDSEEELCTSVRSGDLYSSPDNRLDLIRTLEKEGELRIVEILLKRKDGGLITALENSRVVRDASGKVLYYEGLLTDITERKRAVRKLRESENKFRSITENAVDSIFIKDMARRYTFVNRAMQEMLGLPEEELLGKTPEEIFGTEQGQVIKEVDDRTFSGETVNETRGLVIGGSEHFFNTVQTPLSVEEGEVTSIMGIVRDITERKRAEQNAQDLAHIVERSLNEIYIFDAETLRFIQVNYGARENIGYTAEELSKMTPVDIKPEFTMGSFLQLTEPLRSGAKEIITFETVHERKDASLYDVEVHLQLSEFLDKPVLVAIILDITERKRAEQELASERDRAQKYLDIAGTIMVALNAKGEITLINQKGCRTLGYEEKELLGKNWFDTCLPEELVEDVKLVFARLLAGELELVKYFENDVLTAVGDRRTVAWHNTILLDETGMIVGVLSSGEDITERKLSVEKLRKTTETLEIERQELTEKNIALKQILEHLESQKQSHRQQVSTDMEKALMPAVKRLKKKVGPEFAGLFRDLETAIAVVLSKDIDEHVARYAKLTTRESEICDMIKAGMSSKQIADTLNLSLPTILKHREHARAKLGITGTTLSLSTYLRSH